MSRMAHDFFAGSAMISLPIFAMLLFAGVFLAVTWRAIRTSDSELDEQAALPLEENHHD